MGTNLPGAVVSAINIRYVEQSTVPAGGAPTVNCLIVDSSVHEQMKRHNAASLRNGSTQE